ncbi:MAG: SdrD B-like domain-containing protein, partial [Hormoscilla sp.]
AGTYNVREVQQVGFQQTTSNPTIVLPAGQDRTGVNFGNAELRGSISGVKFLDANENGLRDANEQTLSGWTIFLDTNSNNILDNNEQSAVTGPGGNYLFDDLRAGTYNVREVQQANFRQTTTNPTIVLAAGQDRTGVNFGNAELRGSISGVKFLDNNADGIRNAEEALSGWTIFLDTNNNGILDNNETSDVTETDGSYRFDNLRAGTYNVREIQQTGFESTSPNPVQVVLAAGQDRTGVNFGNAQNRGRIIGEVYQDLNQNGRRDPGEGGIEGFTVFVDFDGDNSLDPEEPAAVTSRTGGYFIPNLAPDTYIIREVQRPNLFTQGVPQSRTVVLNPGETVDDQDFGHRPIVTIIEGRILGQAFFDVNGNGIPNVNEPGIEDIRVYLDINNNGNFESNIDDEALTSTTGGYSFPNLDTGVPYTVRIFAPPGLNPTTATSFSNIIIFNDGSENPTAEAPSFALQPSRTGITGFVFNDLNADGDPDETEFGLSGFTVFADANNNGVLDAGEPFAVSSDNGGYVISDVTPGTYNIELVSQPGFSPTSTDIGNLDNVIIPIPADDPLFANLGVIGTDMIAGTPGVTDTFRLTITQVQEIRGFVDGEDSLALSGSLNLQQLQFLGAGANTEIRIFGSNQLIAVLRGVQSSLITVADFTGSTGGVFGSISGVQFLDADEDGTRDSGEQTLSGWTIFLDSNNNGVLDSNERSAVTGANGSYRFGNLLAGTYNVREVQQAGFEQTTSNPTIVLAAGQNRTGVNLGVDELSSDGSISGVQFLDADGNGTRDSGEQGLAGWTIFLDSNNNGQLDSNERFAVTGANGSYFFTDLEAGTYNVRAIAQSGFEQTTANSTVSNGTVVNIGVRRVDPITGALITGTPGTSDTFSFSSSSTVAIQGFEDGIDVLEVSGGLTFEQIDIVAGTGSSAGNTLISIESSNQVIAELIGVQLDVGGVTIIDRNDFIFI